MIVFFPKRKIQKMGFEQNSFLIFFARLRKLRLGEKNKKLFCSKPIFLNFSFWEKNYQSPVLNLNFTPFLDQKKELSVQSLISNFLLVLHFYFTQICSQTKRLIFKEENLCWYMWQQQQHFQAQMMNLMGRFGDKDSQNDIN